MYVSDLKREFYDVILGKVGRVLFQEDKKWNLIFSIFLRQRVLIFVNFDVDAICSCRILQYLLLCDTVSYSIIPVQNLNELVAAYKESCEQVKHFPMKLVVFLSPYVCILFMQTNHIILINCGGTVDIVQTLEPTEEKIFYIADSHRPYDVCNIYNDGQVIFPSVFNQIYKLH